MDSPLPGTTPPPDPAHGRDDDYSPGALDRDQAAELPAHVRYNGGPISRETMEDILRVVPGVELHRQQWWQLAGVAQGAAKRHGNYRYERGFAHGVDHGLRELEAHAEEFHRGQLVDPEYQRKRAAGVREQLTRLRGLLATLHGEEYAAGLSVWEVLEIAADDLDGVSTVILARQKQDGRS